MTAITFDADGLLPVVAQDEATGDVLLLAYMNAEALRRTLAEGVLVLWSRSRRALWRKGERSGHTLRLSELRVNCEGNSLLARVTLAGPGACHDGYRSCYYRRVRADATAGGVFTIETVASRTFNPIEVYGAAPGSNPASLESVARALYAAYEELRDTDLTAISGTSRRLRSPDSDATARHALARAREELAELRGVVAGTHRHQGLPADGILEAGQVSYWVSVAAIALGYPYDAWNPHMAWLGGWNGAVPPPRVDGKPEPDVAIQGCVTLLTQAGALCREAGVHPADVLAADLAALRAKHPTSFSPCIP